ncbi:MAG: DUF2254 domain-containing protein [Dehalococcoidales bacterium]|nr:DUF2254 domain-containing protein [Dehalococcoidales bacterium]
MKARTLEISIPLGLIIVFTILTVIRITDVFNISIANTDQFNAQYVIGISGLGALAAIFAIVISISLMAVQFASQEYSHRIMNSYIKSFMLWSLITLYIGTMLYNLWVVGFIDPKEADTMITDVSTILQFLCFLMLVPHFIFTTAQLNPLYIIDKILYSVNADYLHSLKRFYRNGRIDVPSNMDKVLSVVEIVEKAIIKGDRDTTRTTLEKLYLNYTENTEKGEPDWIRQYFMGYILRIGQQGVLSEDDDIVVRTIRIIGEVGETAGTATAIEHIRTLGTAALKKDYDVAVQQAIDSLLSILKKSSDIAEVIKIPDILRNLVDDLMKNNKLSMLNYLLDNIAGTASSIADAEHARIAERYIDLLEKIGLAAARNELIDVSHACILAFHRAGIAFVSRGIVSYDAISSSMLRIEYATRNELRAVKSQIDFVIRDIEKHAPAPAKNEIPVPPKAPENGGSVPDVPEAAESSDAMDFSDLWDKDDD